MSSVRVGFILAVCLLTGIAGAQHWVTDIPGNFVDISLTGGTLLASSTTTPVISDDSEHNIVTTVGNAMWPAGNLRVGNNGAVINTLAATPAGEIGYSNGAIAVGTAIPSGTTTGFPAGTVAALCPFWDDLDSLTAGGSEIWWQEMNGILCIMWKNESHISDTAGQTVTFEIQVFNNASGSCMPYVQFLYQDPVFGGTHAAFDNALSATIGYVAGTVGGSFANAQYSSNTSSITAGSVVTLVEGPSVPFGAVLSSPGGPGTAQVDILGSNYCLGGNYFMPITFNPNGPAWFYGLAISITDLFAEFNAGFPYVGAIGTSIGPLTGIPSGLTVWGTTVGWPAGAPPAVHIAGPAWTYTIP
jgi:hypothetical protein